MPDDVSTQVTELDRTSRGTLGCASFIGFQGFLDFIAPFLLFINYIYHQIPCLVLRSYVLCQWYVVMSCCSAPRMTRGHCEPSTQYSHKDFISYIIDLWRRLSVFILMRHTILMHQGQTEV